MRRHLSRPLPRPFVAAVTLVLVGGLATACGGDDDDGQTITVFAASSLTASFEEIATAFEEQNDGVAVEFNFAGSSDLVANIQGGASADVFASADTANMDKITADGLEAADPELFASNTLEIAVPPDNPAGIATFQDLAEPDLNLVICAPDVPCGAASQRVAEAAGVTLSPVSEEASVTDVLGKVTSGEADAGLVYVTDVLAAGDDVEGITFPESSSAVNEYPIAALEESDEGEVSQQFVDFVLGEEGQAILEEYGFAQP